MLLIIFFVFFFGWSMYWEFMPVTWLKILDVTPSQIGLFYAYGIVINSICSALLIRPIFDWISNGKILFFSIVILGTSIVFLLFNLKVSFLWFFIAIEQFMLALIYPSAMTMALKITPKGMQGQTLGNYNSVKALAYAFSPLSGILMGISYKMPFFIAVVFILCSGLLLWISFRKAIFSTNT